MKAFRTHLDRANNKPISDQMLFEFLKHFYLLGYDLDMKTGVTSSLLHSIIRQYTQDSIHSIWTNLINIVQFANENAGTITIETLSEELINLFKQPIVSQIPKEFAMPTQISKQIDQNQYAAELALANLIGSWNEKNNNDIEILQKLTGENYFSWVKKIREILQLSNAPLSFKNGIWKLNRSLLWDMLSVRIFDQDLDKFKSIVVNVLTEIDPALTLPLEKRFAASIYGKVPKYSSSLRKGLAEGLAILGSKPDALRNCSSEKVKTILILTIQEIFSNPNWMLWGSLNNLLPNLAEASPDEFLNTIENTLKSSPHSFDELFSQESDSITGINYFTGLLWALEGLAWDEKYLVRVCAVLGKLANHDPGGNWTNRPINSLSIILLPWHPQTIASIEKRKVAVKTLCDEYPEIGWKLLIKLLPNQHQISIGSYKPSWRNFIPKGWKPEVTNEEYLNQITFYANYALSMAKNDPLKLAELIDNFDNLPKSSFDKLLKILSSKTILNYPENKKFIIWDHIKKFINKHKRFSDAKWALSDELISAIEAVADKLAPSNPLNLYQHLFSDSEFDLYEENGNWEEQRKKLERRRQNAIEDILNARGIKSVIQFSESVKLPNQVGHSLGCIANATIDSFLLPKYLEVNNKLLSFIGGYVWGRHNIKGWSWVDGLDKESWSVIQLGQFLTFLPFCKETWDRVALWLSDTEIEYWSKVNANPYQTEDKLYIAIDKLIEYGRPHAAINCLDKMRHTKQSINVTQCIRALLAALSSKEPTYAMDSYHIVELIKFLQESSKVSSDDLIKIEWAYLPLLDYYPDTSPKSLETHLANNPEFFCEVIRLAYRSKNEDKTIKQLPENLKAIATNAWQLLNEWKTPPGMQKTNFDSSYFVSWLKDVKNICEKSGHLEIALSHVGEVLTYCPSDYNGLWINRTVAKVLNNDDMEDMRNGFITRTYNSRGVYIVDPTGKPEKELAKQFRQKAEEIENAGFYRFALSIKKLADRYDKEAERVINEHKEQFNNENN